MESDIKGRLLAGAKLLGELWRRGERCSLGWSMECKDPLPRNRFCRAKLQWVRMAEDVDGRIFCPGEYAVIEAMKASEFDATGLVAVVQTPKGGRIKVGPGGNFDSMAKLALVAGESGGALASLMFMFPDAQLV